ncbi:MAG: phosphatase PAP2/dual specificity phosphatase family protein [Phycisphaeraceae bacterium]|nr:phosphatase PAP2/dual specificity phosphatase family protein [Phycisphaeraceae bacterium]
MGDLHGFRCTPGDEMKWKALRASVLLSALFLLVYGATNYLAAARENVGSCVCGWEKHIPFVPWFVIPYMSIDLFFVGAPFVCRTERELRAFTKRIAFAIVVSGLFFLFLPLRFAFERPPVAGLLGVVFDGFRALDQPFNQCPSLHVSLSVLLGAVYLRRTNGIVRFVVAVWFGLILLSPVLTYQHHVVDVAGGLALSVLCVFLFPERAPKLLVLPNRRVGSYYITGALLCAAACLVFRPWSWIMLWPAVALGAMGAAYFGVGPGVYRKRRGRLPLTTRLVLWPVLAGQWLSWKHYVRRCNPWDRITDRVWIGGVLTERQARHAIDSGVCAVLDLTGEFSERESFLCAKYRQEPVLDLTAPTPEVLDRVVAFIERCSTFGVVYVHCKIGFSRSAAAVGAYLIYVGIAGSAQAAMSILREKRPSIVIRPEAADAIKGYANRSLRARQTEPRRVDVVVPLPTMPQP